MKISINIRPTVQLRREASRSYMAALVLLFGLPVLALLLVGFYLVQVSWPAETDLQNKVDALAEQVAGLKRNIVAKGLSKARKAEIRQRHAELVKVLKSMIPVYGRMLVELENALNEHSKLRSLSVKRRPSSTLAVHMTGEAASIHDISLLVNALQRKSTGVRLKEIQRDRRRNGLLTFSVECVLQPLKTMEGQQ